MPKYSVHDITRIGLSKRKLAELVDSDIFSITDVSEDFELSDNQRNQVNVAISGKEIIDRDEIKDFLNIIQYPISFLDYETYPSAIPRFHGYHPYDQIPFQFSLHILEKPNGQLKHSEFIFSEKGNPDILFLDALNKMLPEKGSIVVWNKKFETTINKKLGERNPDYSKIVSNINDRVVDLEDPFKFQYLVHPDFKGKTSIKYILPALVPKLSYKKLDIQEGGTASNTWNSIVKGEYSEDETKKQIKNLKKYCELDTLAMVEIFNILKRI